MALGPTSYEAVGATRESPTSGVSWAAIIAGAIATTGLTVFLVALGVGFGSASVSPWTNSGLSAASFGILTAIWLIIVQIISSGVGGYLAGRLRTKWADVRTDEVFFRDTAHGFLTWALGAVVTAVLLASAASSLIGTTAQIGGQVASSAVQGAGQAAGGALSGDAGSYFTDMLFRANQPATDAASDSSSRAEVGRILVSGIRNGDVPAADRTYLARIVAARTGLSQPDAEKRVSDVITAAKSAADQADQKARQAADTARKATSYASLWMAAAMLVGAFVASYAATMGGRQRDL